MRLSLTLKSIFSKFPKLISFIFLAADVHKKFYVLLQNVKIKLTGFRDNCTQIWIFWKIQVAITQNRKQISSKFQRHLRRLKGVLKSFRQGAPGGVELEKWALAQKFQTPFSRKQCSQFSLNFLCLKRPSVTCIRRGKSNIAWSVNYQGRF